MIQSLNLNEDKRILNLVVCKFLILIKKLTFISAIYIFYIYSFKFF